MIVVQNGLECLEMDRYEVMKDEMLHLHLLNIYFSTICTHTHNILYVVDIRRQVASSNLFTVSKLA